MCYNISWNISYRVDKKKKFTISALEFREGYQMRYLNRTLKDKRRPDEWEFGEVAGQNLNRKNDE